MNNQKKATTPIQISIRLEGFEHLVLKGEIVKAYESGWMDVRLKPNCGQIWPDGYPHEVRSLMPKEVLFNV